MKDLREANGYKLTYHQSVNDGELHTRYLIEQQMLSVALHEGARRRPMIWSAEAFAGFYLAIVNVHGTMLIMRGKGWSVLPPRSFLVIRGPAVVHTQVARGQHARLLVAWQQSSTAALYQWMHAMSLSTHTEDKNFWIASCPKGSSNGEAFDRIVAASSRPSDRSLPTIIGALHHLCGASLTQRLEFSLTHINVELPAPVEALLTEVKKSPSASWSLKDAAAFAGYSPFHLSRTFRSLIGYGFPEYVDRCRTELAVQKLAEGQSSIDEIALSCGFGSTQALRDSFREYLGLLPSELRVAAGDGAEPIGQFHPFA